MPFKSLNLSPIILKALHDEGYETPTPIQAKAIPPILDGKDVLGCAQTGTGKTAAFALPIIQRLTEMPIDKTHRGAKHPRALVLSPTRELAAQIGESFATYGRHAGLSHAVIYGGVSQFHQAKAIHRGVDILVATPGRLMDLMEQRIVTLKEVRIFVLDEADRMLDMGFIQPIRRIASQLPKPRQTLLFSATMPKEIMHLADSLLHEPVKVAVSPGVATVPQIEQRLYMVPFRQKQVLLERLLDEPGVERAIVFTKTKHGADRVCKNLNHDGVPAVAIHGNKAQNYRTRALDGFRSGKTRVLVATDVAARGLDVDGITHVFNFDLPMEPEAYVHRIGRTGRAGATGIAIAFCDGQEHDLLRQVQRLLGKQIPVVQLPSDLPMPERTAHPADGRRDGDRSSRGSSHGSSYGSSRGGSSQGSSRGPSRSSYGSRPMYAGGNGQPARPAASHSSGHSSSAAPSHAAKHPANHAPVADRRPAPAPHAHAPAHAAAPHAPRPHHSAPADRPGHVKSGAKPHRKGPNSPNAKTQAATAAHAAAAQGQRGQGHSSQGRSGQGGAFSGGHTGGNKPKVFTRSGPRKPTHR